MHLPSDPVGRRVPRPCGSRRTDAAHPAGAPLPPRPRCRAFTLVEVLLVLAIMGIMTLVSMPYLVKSIRGNRLRVATATVVQAGRYARSMALLGQQEVRLTFDINEAAIRIEPRRDSPRPGGAAESAPAPEVGVGSEPAPVAGTDSNEAPARVSPLMSVSRRLDAVRIDYVEVGNQGRESTGTVTIVYRSNGRCTPYEVRVVDEFDSATLTRVDALSTPNTERDDR